MGEYRTPYILSKWTKNSRDVHHQKREGTSGRIETRGAAVRDINAAVPSSIVLCARTYIYIFVCIYIDIDSLVETGLLMEYIYILALGPINEKSSRVPAVCVSVQKL